jgi:hypothetical protein
MLPWLVASLHEEGMRADRLAEDVSRLLARWERQGLVDWR